MELIKRKKYQVKDQKKKATASKGAKKAADRAVMRRSGDQCRKRRK